MAVVAPFWDDADFSTHRGTIFYQVGLSKLGFQDHTATSKERQRNVWRVVHMILLSEPCYCCQSPAQHEQGLVLKYEGGEEAD